MGLTDDRHHIGDLCYGPDSCTCAHHPPTMTRVFPASDCPIHNRRYSVTPTFDSRVVGEPYTLEIREGDQTIRRSTMPDPFHNTTIHPRGWRVALAVLLRRYKVSVHVGAPSQLVEDVSELDDNYRGMAGSKRRAEADAELDGALRDFAARVGEHGR